MGYFIYYIGAIGPYVVKMAQNPKLAHFDHIWAHTTNIVYKIPPQTIYFWNLLIATVILSYRTLKSNNFEKLTYNANLKFSKGVGGPQKLFFHKKILHVVFKCLLSPYKTSALWNL